VLSVAGGLTDAVIWVFKHAFLHRVTLVGLKVVLRPSSVYLERLVSEQGTAFPLLIWRGDAKMDLIPGVVRLSMRLLMLAPQRLALQSSRMSAGEFLLFHKSRDAGFIFMWNAAGAANGT
jgi:hypothetical protein